LTIKGIRQSNVFADERWICWDSATAGKPDCVFYRLKDGQAYQEPDLHTNELKYKNHILRFLRTRQRFWI
jgi:hypothetical protein